MARGKKRAGLRPSTSAGLIRVDGAQGEGGGQILRSSLALAALTGRPVRLERMRAGRAKPGLAAQHLTSVRAVAEVANAHLEGDTLGSMDLLFRPRREVRGGRYSFNVALQRKGGSAGAVALVLQSILLPLALSGEDSEVTLLGGTHVAHSPPYDFLEQTFLPTLAGLGLEASLDLRRAGFYPVGGGRLSAHVKATDQLSPLTLERPGALEAVHGRLLTAKLEPHVAERMEAQARELLAPLGVELVFEHRQLEAKSPGAAIFLEPRYERGRAGFSAVGERGRPAEQVATEAVEALLANHATGAAVDVRLADQLLLPLSFASGPSSFTTERASNHLKTNAAVIEQFGLAKITISDTSPTRVTVTPR